MSTKFNRYIDDSLASTGFVVLNSQVAYTMRSDLWSGGMECGADFGSNTWRNRLGYIQGLKRFHVRIAGIPGLVDVYSRSADSLARRLEWITGFEIENLYEEQELAGELIPEPTPERPRNVAEDRYKGIVTAEPARSCSSCDCLTAGHACRKAPETGIAHPAANIRRLCLGYTPMFDASDMRKGPQIWPELVGM